MRLCGVSTEEFLGFGQPSLLYIKSDYNDTVIFGGHPCSFPCLIIFTNPIPGILMSGSDKAGVRMCDREQEREEGGESKGSMVPPLVP